MTERLIGETGSRKRRRFLFLPVVLVACLALFVVAGAQAVHDETFQLDGNTVTGAPTNIGGVNTQNVDWATLFDQNGDTVGSLPDGYGDANLVPDFQTSGNNFVTNDQTTFATGSKDTLPISGWQCNFDNNVNSKIDVMNSYAATYVDDNGTVDDLTDDEEILYFGIERNVNTGTANVGFWFLQSPVGCTSTGGAVSFTGEHQDGDLLVVSEFSGGGTVSTINAYRWDRPDDDLPGSLNPTPIANGVDCRSVTLGTEDATCGVANTGTITTPWLTAQKTTVGHTLGTALFFEAGLNLTDSGLGGQCFSTFLGDTRSSTSLTATLFDFSGGTLGECGVSVTTSPSQSTRVLGSADPITDLADISGTGAGGSAPTPTGTMTFFLCAPSAVTAAGCPAGAGTQVGTAVTLGACDPVVAGHACATSANAASLVTVSLGRTASGRFTIRHRSQLPGQGRQLHRQPRRMLHRHRELRLHDGTELGAERYGHADW